MPTVLESFYYILILLLFWNLIILQSYFFLWQVLKSNWQVQWFGGVSLCYSWSYPSYNYLNKWHDVSIVHLCHFLDIWWSEQITENWVENIGYCFIDEKNATKYESTSFNLSIPSWFSVGIFFDFSHIHDLCYFTTLGMMMESRAFSKRSMSFI